MKKKKAFIFGVLPVVAIGSFLAYAYVLLQDADVPLPKSEMPEQPLVVKERSSSISRSPSSARVYSDEERAENLRRTATIARSLHSESATEVPLKEFTHEELGIAFSYPAQWGDVSINIDTPETKPEWIAEGFEVSGRFSANSDVTMRSISPDYKDVPGGRGMSTEEAIVWFVGDGAPYPRDADYPKADYMRLVGDNKKLLLWYAWPVGWDTGEYMFAFRAPVKHQGIQHIAFVGPKANVDTTTEQDIQGFLLLANSYELLN